MITLSIKDADFIAQVARDELKLCQEYYSTKYKEFETLSEITSKVCEEYPDDNPKVIKIKEEMVRAQQTLTDLAIEDIARWTKIVELMMGGSNE